jgi:peptidoglycan/xylan/chitin deacetylase (PgdA/CDA1 family)
MRELFSGGNVKYYLNFFLKIIYLKCGFVTFRNYIYKIRQKSLITVLAYHRVAIDEDDINAVSLENFEKQMAFLKRRYSVIRLDELLSRMNAGLNDERSVVITFDDGYLDNYTNAVPILEKYELPASFFISTGFIGSTKGFMHDKKRLGRKIGMMSWDNIRELSNRGFSIGSHTVNHVRLSDCDFSTQWEELVSSKWQIESNIGKEVSFFSYPYGRPSDISTESIKNIKRAGYACNLSSDGGLVSPKDDVYQIKRVGVPNHSSLFFFNAWVEGWKIFG